MYEVTGNVYGLANAPESFARKMLFLHYSESAHELDAVAGWHVDDLIFICSLSLDMDKIRGSFTWGSWQLARA
eukprot:2465152-Amphidinium_carterae.1